MSLAASSALAASTTVEPINVTQFSPARDGSSAAGNWNTVASNPTNGRNLFFYFGTDSAVGYYGARVADSTGPVGSEQVVFDGSSGAYTGCAGAAIQLAAAYNPVTKGWIVAYREICDVGAWKVQLLNADGSLDGSALPLSTSSLAFSPQSNRYLLTERIDGELGAQLLDASGNPVGSYLLPFPSLTPNYAPTVTYNAARDEFAVAMEDCGAGCALWIQRIDASDGSLIGDPEAPAPDGVSAAGYRPRIVASACADEYYVTTSGDSDSQGGILGWRVAGDLSGSLDTTAAFFSDTPYVFAYTDRVNVTYNRYSNTYFTSFAADYSSGGDDWNLSAGPLAAGVKDRSIPGRTDSKGKPSIKRKGAGGATSLRVKVSCSAGSGPCRIRLTGRLKGGKGKIRSKTVKVKGKSKVVKLDYTSKLISELNSRGGGKIRVTAKEVGGGKASTIVVVPASVTG